MLDPPPMIEFLELHACSVKSKVVRLVTPSNGARAAIATQNSSTVYTVARQRTSVGFKLAVRGDSGAGGLVAPLTLYSILR